MENSLAASGPVRRVAIVHEWLVAFGGAELVLRELLKLFPQARVFTLVDSMDSAQRAFLGVGDTSSSFLNRLPGIDRRYRSMLPLFPAAVRSLDLRGFDVVISNSHAVAKGVRVRPGQLHLSYCLTPMRYAWDLREQYLTEAGLSRGIRGIAARALLESLRRWDRANSTGVHGFATLSHFVADRIRRSYSREATVIYPPVDTEFFVPAGERSDYYVTASRFVPYKRVDLIAKAFSHLPDRKLVIVGDGPDATKVRAAAGPNVTLAGHVERTALRTLLQRARAFLFAAEEDFGIAPLEAQAAGVPVIAYGRGGAAETVRGLDHPRPTGVHFAEQTADAIAAAVRQFEASADRISAAACRENAERFNEARFRDEFLRFVDAQWAAHAGSAAALDTKVLI
ncbi:MAG TPA: glycosyltransferase [Gemmatimonadaceae bacterium]|nr:glycosyltransferase [Gemmatimonadaceae bacterium]